MFYNCAADAVLKYHNSCSLVSYQRVHETRLQLKTAYLTFLITKQMSHLTQYVACFYPILNICTADTIL